MTRPAATADPAVRLLIPDHDIRDLLCVLLAHRGYEVQVLAGLDALGEGAPDMTLVDVWGCGHPTLSMGERARLRAWGTRQPLVVLTGDAWAALGAGRLGVAALLPLPFTPTQVVAALRQAEGEATDAPTAQRTVARMAPGDCAGRIVPLRRRPRVRRVF